MWTSVGLCSHLWTSVDLSGPLWTSADLCGTLCIKGWLPDAWMDGLHTQTQPATQILMVLLLPKVTLLNLFGK